MFSLSFDDHAIRAVILYEYLLGSTARYATDRINDKLGVGTVSYATVHRWFQRFAAGNISLMDEDRSGRPIEMEDRELLDYVRSHPSASTREIGQALGRSNSTIHDRLLVFGYRRVLSRWIPHQLSASNRAARVSICQSLLLRFERENFLTNLVTGDESWVFYKNVTRAAYWLPPGEEPPVQPRPETHGPKVMLCCWWDMQGMLYWELLAQGQTVTAEVYTRQLRQLAAAIQEKRPGRTEVDMQHDNARPHIASATHQQLMDLGWNTIPHPPYSPDLAPSDFHLFHSLKEHLHGHNFRDFDHIKDELARFFESQSADFWQRGILALPERWRRVIDLHGDYIVE